MPSLVGHALVGVTAAAAVTRTPLGAVMSTKRWLLLLAAVSAAPDLDVISFYWVPYEHPMGHRGFWHSAFFASVASAIIVYVLRATGVFHGRGGTLVGVWAVAAIVMATHGPLDALTNGGLGIALLSPFDQARYFLTEPGLGPIPVAALNPIVMTRPYMRNVLLVELALFVPACLAAWVAAWGPTWRPAPAWLRFPCAAGILALAAWIWHLQLVAVDRGALWFW